MNLGQRLKKARDSKRYTQLEAAKKLGISNGTLSGYERNYRDPDTDTLTDLANLYEVSLDWLLGKEIKNTKESAFTLPVSEFERIIKEIEEEQNIDLHGNPIAHQAVKQALEIIVRAMKTSE